MRWVTRERPKTDRIACPWLIRRFIDPDAEIVYLASDRVLAEAEPEDSHSFDAKGAEYTHRGLKCSFETLIDEFDLGGDLPESVDLEPEGLLDLISGWPDKVPVDGGDFPRIAFDRQSQFNVRVDVGGEFAPAEPANEVVLLDGVKGDAVREKDRIEPRLHGANSQFDPGSPGLPGQNAHQTEGQ